MFEYINLTMWPDGTEHCTAYENFALDEREIWYGTSYSLENDHKYNTWRISMFNQNGYIKTVAHGKEETLCLCEFKKWLEDRKIKDGYMDFIRGNKWYREKYPLAMGVKFIA